MAQGYWHKEELTKQVFQAKLKNGDGPFLRTGDLGFICNGELFISGRRKDLIIIHGRNYYPQDIEQVCEESHPDIRLGCTVAFEIEKNQTSQLVIVSEIKENNQLDNIVQAIRMSIVEKLELAVYAIVLLPPKGLEKTTSGKVRRQSAKNAFLSKKFKPIHTWTFTPSTSTSENIDEQEPYTATETRLAKLWREVLGIKAKLNNNFLAQGGNSILLTQLRARIRQEFQIEIPIIALTDNPTLKAMAQQIDAARANPNAALLPENILLAKRPLIISASFSQQRFWFLHQLIKNAGIHNIFAGIKLIGQVDKIALTKAVNTLVERHESLRTSFYEQEYILAQRIHAKVEIKLEEYNLTQTLTENSDQALQQILLANISQAFKLETPPLLRGCLIQVTKEEYILALVFHHAIVDGWSMQLLTKELTTCYNAYHADKVPQLSPVSIQYADFAVWQQNYLSTEKLTKQLSYWRKQLQDLPDVLNLPTDKPRPLFNSYSGAHYQFKLAKKLVDELKQFSSQHDATLFMSLMAVFNILLYRYSGQSDITIGFPDSNRQQHADLQQLIGLLVNTLTARTQLSSDQNFIQLLKQVKTTLRDAYANSEIPFDYLVNQLKVSRNSSHNPLFQVMLAMQNKQTEITFEDLKAEPIAIDTRTAMFDLTLDAQELINGELALSFEYATDLFEHATIVRLAQHFEVLVQAVINSPVQAISELPLLTEGERKTLLFDWNATQAEYPADKTLHQLFEEQAQKTPNNIAIVFEGLSLTYGELNAKSNQLAHYLKRLGIKPNTLVAISMERSFELIIGLLGILKAGGAYVPVDPNYPIERIQFMLRNTQTQILLTHSNFRQQFGDYNGQMIALDLLSLTYYSQANLGAFIQSQHLAYVIYTSGSTGEPKGVMVGHKNIVNTLYGLQSHYEMRPSDKFIHYHSYSFDVSLEEIFLPLSVGASVIVAKPKIQYHLDELATLLSETKATCIGFTPSPLHGFLDYIDSYSFNFEALRLISIGNEAVSVSLVKRIQAKFPRAVLINMYGPTECAVDAISFQFPANFTQANVPIGRPLANTFLYILNSAYQPMPIGVPGELYIGGAGVAQGYWNQAALTAERFINNPFATIEDKVLGNNLKLYRTGDLAKYLADGNIEYVGRIDEQVKIRGFRIELGEIESIINNFNGVKQNVVTVYENDAQQKQLVAYIVPVSVIPENQMDSWITLLRAYLAQKLPDYMLPSHIRLLEKLPLTPNGKLDRKSLPKPNQIHHDQAFVAPETQIQKALAAIWSKLLAVEATQISIHDNFFNLGGHSLLLTTMLAEVKKQLQLEFSTADFISHPTIANLAALCSKQNSNLHWQSQLANRIEQDAQLPDTIKVNNETQVLLMPKVILLTGATGFIGVHLLRELLTSTQAHIICLIRAETQVMAKTKLIQQLKKYNLIETVDLNRVEILLGNLAKSTLGLSQEEMIRLAKEVDSIYHNGALVHHIYDYITLYPSNVASTLELIKLSVTHKNKQLHFISTLNSEGELDEFGKKDEKVPNNTLPMQYKSGYEQSKWVAERLIAQAQDRGIRASIYRLSFVQGQQETGIVNEGNHFTLILKSCIQLGIAPDINIDFELTPVDIVSKSIVALSLNSDLLPVYHLNNPHTLNWKELINFLCEQNYVIQLMEKTSLQKKYLTNLSPDNALFAVAAYYGDNFEIPDIHKVVCTKTQAQLIKLGIHYPKIEKDLLTKYINYLIKTGFLPKPSTQIFSNVKTMKASTNSIELHAAKQTPYDNAQAFFKKNVALLNSVDIDNAIALTPLYKIDNDQEASLFLIHSDDGSLDDYRNIQPFSRTIYGIANTNLKNFVNIAIIAEAYIKIIKTKQAEGPYYIGGFSLGGVIALEMAQQLSAQGEKINLVVMLDSLCCEYRPKEMNKTQYSYANQLLDDYKPKRYEGPVLLIKATKLDEINLMKEGRLGEWYRRINHNPSNGWQSYLSNLNIKNINVKHSDFFNNDYVKILINKIKECLEIKNLVDKKHLTLK